MCVVGEVLCMKKFISLLFLFNFVFINVGYGQTPVFQNQLNMFGSDTDKVIKHAKQMGYDYVVGQPWSKTRAHKAKAAGLHVLWNSNKEYPKYVRVNMDGTRYNVGQGPNGQGWPITTQDTTNFNNMFCMKKSAVNADGTINQSVPVQDRFQTWKNGPTEKIFYANMQCKETAPLLLEYNKKLFVDHGGTEIFDGLFIDGVGTPMHLNPDQLWYLPCYNPCLNDGIDFSQRQGEIEYLKLMKNYFVGELKFKGWSGNPWTIPNYADAYPTLPIDLLYIESGKEQWNNPSTWGNIPAKVVSVQLPGDRSGATQPTADYALALKTLGSAAAVGAWFGWYGEASVDNTSAQNQATNSTQLARALPNWDNLVNAGSRSWNYTTKVYTSSNSYADPNIIYSRHAKTKKIFVVWQNTNGKLKLKSGEKITSVQKVDSIFIETGDGTEDLVNTNGTVSLNNNLQVGKGYVITVTSEVVTEKLTPGKPGNLATK